jgi:hypothetical protein
MSKKKEKVDKNFRRIGLICRTPLAILKNKLKEKR